MIETERLRLCHWRDDHLEPFTEMHADTEVMADLGGPYPTSESKKKFDRFRQAESEYGIARWAVEDRDGNFLGYSGVMPYMKTDLPLGQHYEIGWRFKRSAWGHGYASESANAALSHALKERGLAEVVAYTDAANYRSQAVMTRIGLIRKPELDFTKTLKDGREYQGRVWASS